MNNLYEIGENHAKIYSDDVCENSNELTELDIFLLDSFGLNSLNPIYYITH